MKIELNSERLDIRTVTEEAASNVLDYYQDNHVFLREWEPLKNDEYFTVEYHKKVLGEEVHKRERGEAFRFWLYKKGEDRIIGMVILNNIIRGVFQSCFLGYNLSESENGKGYMSEALKVVIDYAFNTQKLHRIEANIMPRNRRSFKVVEKLGFHEEGLAKDYLKINGQWEDHVHMVILNEKV